MSRRAVFLMLLFACGSPSNGRFAGAIEGSDARAAMVIEDEAFILYVCGGPTSLERTRWLSGLSIEDRIATLGFEGTRGIDRIEGLLDDGIQIDLSRVDENGGLFASNQGPCRTGVVVSDDSIQGVSCDEAGRFEQVNPDGPVNRDGFMVQVGSRTLFVEPAHPE